MNSNPPQSLTLDQVAVGQRLVVLHMYLRDAPAAWATWLEDIGFIPGEEVTLLRRDVVGGDAMVFRVGASTFALRRAEAACIVVQEAPPA